MSTKEDGNLNAQGAKVLKLGLNISVSGDPGTDFEIVLDENGQKAIQSSMKCVFDVKKPLELNHSASDVSGEEKSIQEAAQVHSTNTFIQQNKITGNMNLSNSPRESEEEKTESKDSSIIDKIRTTMEHFEKFSDHIKEIPRLKNHPVATSTPFSDKQNSKSELSLVYPEYAPRKFSHLYDFQSKKEYFKSSFKPPDLFLKPLPGENYYKKGMYTRYFDLEPYRHYASDNSLNKASEYKIICAKPKHDVYKHDVINLPTDHSGGILKKSDSESGDKHSTSSTDSIKDIKIYQSGGILIMQNFKDNLDAIEKKEMSDFSAKLIENCNKLKEEITNFQMERPLFENLSDENKNFGKTVQFDLTSVEGQKSKSADSSAGKDETSFVRVESSESTSDCPKTKESSPQGTSQSQDFPSISTQENDSINSNQPGTSPTFVSPKKLEWDSGADIGYMNIDLMKRNLSTIERIVLKGLSSDGLNEKSVVYKEKPEKNQNYKSKVILKKIPSDLSIEEITDCSEKQQVRFDNSDSNNKREERSEFLQQMNEEKRTKKISKAKKEKKNVTGTSSQEDFKGKNFSKLENSKLHLKSASVKEKEKVELKEKRSCGIDKSVNVNTLWTGLDCETPLCQRIETESLKPAECHSKFRGRKCSPKVKKLKKRRLFTQRFVSLKDKADSLSGRLSKSSSFETSIPKKSNNKLEEIPVINDVELSKEVEEIIIDQRYKTKQIANDKEKEFEYNIASKLPVDEKAVSKSEGKAKSRPISASSSSNNTVLPKTVENKMKAIIENKFVNQKIQTSDLDCESVGIQAFASQISSDCDLKSSRIREETKEIVNTSSKNIQAFGLNASLPKQLEHPKESTEFITNQNTKGTQFFGGLVNSLPNYHSNLLTKPIESCGQPKILKAKKNLEAEIIRLKEENEKNILANDTPKVIETKAGLRKLGNNENKENLFSKTSTNSKKSESDASRKTSKENESASQGLDKKENEHQNSKEKKNLSVEESECVHTSDEVSSMVLTSEVLRVHGDSIDRNIIQEKYFQSQLVEFQKKKMVTRSTSMEMETEERDASSKRYMSIGCQYSPQSKETKNEEQFKYQENDFSKGKAKCQGRGTSEQYDSNQDISEDCFETWKSTNQERGLGTGDSLPSSTQTAHSWIPGMQNPGENISGVGRARSFEYLPGHIYESSGNLREKLPSETEQNIVTSNSSDSDTAKCSLSDRAGESEGRNTLVLENSTESSQNSDRLKILDGNLTQLDFAVLKLRKKDAQIQNVIQSLLANLLKKTGSGDYSALGGADVSKSEVMSKNKELSSSGKERGDTPSHASEEEMKSSCKQKEISIACQTVERSSPSESEKFYGERKALEKRISEEKKCQIKWIENEIYHLNILRELLEKQKHTEQKKKDHSPVILSSKINENRGENISTKVHSRSETPLYGCTISVTGNGLSEVQHSDPRPREREEDHSQWCHYPEEESLQYEMAVSLSGKDKSKSWRRVVMLPVGVQVSLRDANALQECSYEEVENKNVSQLHRHSSNCAVPDNTIPRHNPCMYDGVSHSDVNTQYPSARRNSGNFPSTSVQTNPSSPERCAYCNEENCVCINLEKSYSSPSRSSRSKTSERRGSSKLTSLSEEPELENDIENKNKNSESTDNLKKFPDNAWDLPGKHSKTKSIHCSHRKCQNVVENKSGSPENHDKRGPIQNPDCRCQNCFIQVSSGMSRQDFSCHCPCQSNIYLNIDKSSSDFGTCRCSKIQAQKSSNSACHIIKIHGAKCCSPGKGSCCCKSRTAIKRMENQYCQTDLTNLMPEDPKGHFGAEKVDITSSDPRGSCDRRQQNAKQPEANIPEIVQRQSCDRSRKAEKNKTKTEDHPRHYFLKIEETVIDDDSKESVEQQKSLEVITVTVPVKKAGKTKIYGSKIQNFRESHEDSAKPLDFPSNGCNCCSECIAHRSKPAQEYESRFEGGCSRSLAEKPESPRRDRGFCTKQNSYDSYENENSYGFVGSASKALSREYSPQEYLDRSSTEFAQPEAYSEKRTSGSHTSQCCEDCNCSRRNNASGNFQEIQSEYDSHKKSRGENMKDFYQNRGSSFYESKKKIEKRPKTSQNGSAGKNSLGWSPESNFRQQDFARKCPQQNYDYYNYNKREFMTKSELLKEEEQKHKVHNPSLKEYLSSNRPDFYNSAEKRRQIISERAKERIKKHSNRMECLMNLIHRCCEEHQASNGEPKRIFTTVQMREQTMKRYKKLPEVTGKLAHQKKKEEYRTNKLMAEIFAKKLQSEALKGHVNLSNSVALLHTI